MWQQQFKYTWGFGNCHIKHHWVNHTAFSLWPGRCRWTTGCEPRSPTHNEYHPWAFGPSPALPPVWLPFRSPPCAWAVTPGTQGCWHHDTNGLQVQPSGLRSGWLPQKASAFAGGWHPHEPICCPGSETGTSAALGRAGRRPQDPDLQLPVRAGGHVFYHGFLHSDGRQEGPPSHSIAVPLQHPGQPGTFDFQPLRGKGRCTYQRSGQIHHVQGGVWQQPTPSGSQSAG